MKSADEGPPAQSDSAALPRPGRVLAATWRPLRQHVRGLLLFHLWFGGWSALVLTPGLAWLVDWLAGPGRHAAITNEELVGFFTSFSGLLWLLLSAATAAGLLHFSQIGACTVLLGTGGDNGWAALKAGLSRLPLLIRMSLRQFVLLLPVLALAAAWLALIMGALLGGHDINYYLHQHPPVWWWALGLAALVGITHGGLLLWLVARWLFAVPLLAAGQVADAREALRRSWRLTRGQTRRLLPPLALGWAGVSLASLLAALATRFLADATLDRVGAHVGWVLFIVAATLLALAVVGWLAGALGASLHAAVTLTLFAALDPKTARQTAAALSADAPVAAPASLRRLSPRHISMGLAGALAAVMAGLGFWMEGLEFQDTAALTAHRGISKKAPENTLAAFRQALEDGADYIELDVQTTRDGQVVVLHDADFMRLAGDPRRLADLTLAEAQRIDVGRRFDPRFAGEHVPTLANVIDAVRGRGRLNIELKYNRPDPELIPAVLRVLEEQQFSDQCVLTSLSTPALAEVRRRNPKLRLGQILTQSVGNPLALDVDFFSVNRATLTGAFVNRAHRAGKGVHVWTVNTPDAIHRALDLGVDNLITDYPALACRILNERAALSPPEQLALRLRHLLQD